MTPNVSFKRLHPFATLPTYAHPGDAGMDLTAVEAVIIPPHSRAIVPTGLAIELPSCTEAQVRPRSGLAAKQGITVLNSPGTIDQGYRGEIKVILYNTDAQPFEVTVGMRIAQLVIAPVMQANVGWIEDFGEDTQRGTGGFGSSGV